VNEAYAALRDPVARAQYLLALRGIDAMPAHDTRLPLPFLERQHERREEAAAAAAAGDLDALETMLREVRAEAPALEARLGTLLDVDGAWDEASLRVRELRFLHKLAEDVDAMAAEVEA
jgi:molecular chaperone HscB